MEEKKIDRKRFYDTVRPMFGKLKQSHVQGFETILNEWESRNLKDIRHLAYMLATVFHETAKTMQPIAEYGKGKGKEYGNVDENTGKIYYGRGYVQLTWKYNYQVAKNKLGVDFINDPDLVMLPEHAVKILFEGMLDGWFTGKSLIDYINEKCDYMQARKIINGRDKASLIKGYATIFEKASS